MKKTILLTFFNLFLLLNLYATHNRAGEITYRQIGDKQIECTISIYNNAASVIATSQRDSLEINWGDGNIQWLYRVNGADIDGDGIPEGELIDEEYGLSLYKGEHTYSELNIYLLSMSDPNRNAGILNFNFPNIPGTPKIPFYIETVVFLSEDENSSPTPMLAPIDIAYLGEPFVHVPNAVDLDGDKILYRMVTPKMDVGQVVPNYVEVTDIMPGPTNTLTLDETTGMLIWDAPQQVGEYNIAIEILTYRNGELNGRMIRDMQILVMPDDNLIPDIDVLGLNDEPINNVEVGDIVQFEVNTEDPNLNQIVELSFSSELLESFSNLPNIQINNENTNTPSATISWVVATEHAREMSYQFVIKTKDNLGLANFEVLTFNVLGGTSSIPKQEEELLQIFPNPSNDFISIKNLNQNNQVYSIYNLERKIIQQGMIGQNELIDIQKINKGAYYIKVGNRRAKKLIVN